MNTPQPTNPNSPLLPPVVVPRMPSNVPVYAAFLFGVMFIGLAAIVAITVARPAQDNAPLYVTIIGFLTTTLTAGLAFIKSQEAAAASATNAETLQTIHLSINSRFDEFIREAKALSRAEGVKETEDTGRARDASAAAAAALVPLVPAALIVPPMAQAQLDDAATSRARLEVALAENTRLTRQLLDEQQRQQQQQQRAPDPGPPGSLVAQSVEVSGENVTVVEAHPA